MVLAERLMSPFARLKHFFQSPPSLEMVDDGVLHSHRVRKRPPHDPEECPPSTSVTIPCPDPTAEERVRDKWQSRGQRLARQEDWSTLCRQITEADTALDKTVGGMPIADLLSYGARADVVEAVEHALMTGRPAQNARVLDGIEALERVLADAADDQMLAIIVAQAHMDLGWAWRGAVRDADVPAPNRAAFDAHLDRAAEILAPFSMQASTSPLLASAHCALASGRKAPVQKLVNAYETWADLDPKNARALRAMGVYLLPRWHGSYARLELEARRAAGRTCDVWGAGGYTWVMFDAIANDTEACAQLDLDFFIDGMRDILRNSRDQHTVNLMAAYCANITGATPTGHEEADYIRNQIAATGKWIVRWHLTELHPMLWAHAARGFDNALRVRNPARFAASGQNDALRYLSNVFRRELDAGRRVTFTTAGVTTEPG